VTRRCRCASSRWLWCGGTACPRWRSGEGAAEEKGTGGAGDPRATQELGLGFGGLPFVQWRSHTGVRARSRGGRRRSRRGGRYAGEERGEEEEALTRGARRSEGDGGELERASALGLREKGGPAEGGDGPRAWPTREEKGEERRRAHG
jgi:hypothetical protein